MLEESDMQEVLNQFPQIEFAFAYGSGVMKQKGYNYTNSPSAFNNSNLNLPNSSTQNVMMNNLKISSPSSPPPMFDFIFAVNDSKKWHEENMKLNPHHYINTSFFTPKVISHFQENYGGRIWFNTLIPVNISRYPNRMMKYGVISKNDLINDLNNWDCLYVAGRLQKPVQILKSDYDISLAMSENKNNALRMALLLANPDITEEELYITIASLSYAGDPRMFLGVENPNKIVISHYRSSYDDSFTKLKKETNINLTISNNNIHHDTSPIVRNQLFSKLPISIQKIFYPSQSFKNNKSIIIAPSQDIIKSALSKVVMRSSVTQSAKGILTAGIVKASTYITQKIFRSRIL